MAQAVPEGQQQDLALLGGQRSEGVTEGLGFGGIHLDGGGRESLPDVVRQRWNHLEATAVPPQLVNGSIPGQAQDPGACRATRLIRPRTAPNEEEDLMREVFRAWSI